MLEENHEGRLHLHGVIELSKCDLPEAKMALRAAGGEWEGEGGNNQLDMKQNPDGGWLKYVTKHLQKPKTFPGKAIYASRGLRPEAEALYTKHRQILIKFRKSKVT